MNVTETTARLKETYCMRGIILDIKFVFISLLDVTYHSRGCRKSNSFKHHAKENEMDQVGDNAVSGRMEWVEDGGWRMEEWE